MLVTTQTLRGCGIEQIEAPGLVTTEALSLTGEGKWLRVKIELDNGDHPASVEISLDELQTIVAFLRSKSIEIDPLRAKQQKVALAFAQSFGLLPAPTAASARAR